MAEKEDKAVAKAAAPKEPTAVELAVARGVERWLGENLRNTAFSQDTAAWNVLQNALPKLVPAIVEEIG